MALQPGRYLGRYLTHTLDDKRQVYGVSCGDPRFVAKYVGDHVDDRREIFAAANCGTWKHARYLTHTREDGRQVYAFADPCCGSGSASGSGSSGPDCVISCCYPHPPKRRMYVTLTRQAGDIGCDCVPSITVPIDLTGIGTFAEPINNGCDTNELWYQWDGMATTPHCFNPSETLNFSCRLICDPAGVGLSCMGYVLYVSIWCSQVGTFPGFFVSSFPDACTCEPLYLHYATNDYTYSPECGRNTAGDAANCLYDAVVTE